MSKKRFYVVWKGRRAGVFETWDECAVQVNGYPGAEYKGFDSRADAEAALLGTYADCTTTAKQPGVLSTTESPKQLTDHELRRIGKPITESYSVDAACSVNPGVVEYRGVHNPTRDEVFKQGPYAVGTSNIGEFLAIVHALALFKRRRVAAPIYSDSEIAIGWVECKKCGTRLERVEDNARIFDLIERAEKWLIENDYQNRVLKWHTEIWGEIPADFGRKR